MLTLFLLKNIFFWEFFCLCFNKLINDYLFEFSLYGEIESKYLVEIPSYDETLWFFCTCDKVFTYLVNYFKSYKVKY